MLERNIQADRAWNTWDVEHPAGLVYLPAGFQLRLGAYSTAAGSGAWLRMSDETRLGLHGTRAEYVEVETRHAGSTIHVSYAKLDAATMLGSVRLGPLREWGLRFWLLLVAGFDADARHPGRILDAAGDPTVFLIQRRSVVIALACADAPLRAGRYSASDTVLRDLERRGYFAPHEDEPDGTWSALRFNGEETPLIRFCVAAGNAAESAVARARAGLADGVLPLTAARERLERTQPALQGGPCAGSLEAVGDVIAWNTIWDQANHRPYTTLTRQWVPVKFGGWITWMNDLFYHALLAAQVDPELAEQNVRTGLSMATPEGNLACLLSEHDEWVDRSQPPIVTYLLWLISVRAGSTPLLELAYDTLAANHRWWFANRDGNGNALLEYGTSRMGTGLFVGTKLACKDESTMDNSPLWDDARYVPETGTLDCEDVGLNSLLALDAELLALIAVQLGRHEEAARWEEEAAACRERLSALWHEERGLFVNRYWDGRWSEHIAPTSFYPLLAGAATPEQAARMVREHLLNPAEFWGEWVLPAISRDDPGARDNVYWRGRIWPPLNFLVCQGLRRYGFDREAHDLALAGVRLFMTEWDNYRHCHENFNAETGEGHDGADSDPFYTWGALLPLLGTLDLLDVSPWRGLELGGDPDAGVQTLRQARLADGHYTYSLESGTRRLERNGHSILRTTARGRLTGVLMTPGVAALTLPPQTGAVTIEWPAITRPALVSLRVDELEVTSEGDGAHVTLRLGPADAVRRITVLYRP
ncbi:MAG TPA: trehalase family glycosidase [Chloroflexota bacterium]|nr:trehalase family glycosidase [Chloroflexota bacterium]